MEQAEKIDKKVKNNEELGMLAGVPVTVKVNIDQKNYATITELELISIILPKKTHR